MYGNTCAMALTKYSFQLIVFLVIWIGLVSLKPGFIYFLNNPQQANKWSAPQWTDTLVRPSLPPVASLKNGRQLYLRECIVCHGENGRGDGESGFGLDVPPGDFNDAYTLAESDGSLYWKITYGRKPMPSFVYKLSELQRWQLVIYLRDLQRQFRSGKSK